MTSTLPAFIDGKPKLLFIDGRSVPAVSGKRSTPSTRPPASCLAQVAEAAAGRVDLAVAAARRAFEEGPWSRIKPFDRQQVMLRLADLVEKHYDELALLDTLDMGGPDLAHDAGPPARRRAAALLRRPGDVDPGRHDPELGAR